MTNPANKRFRVIPRDFDGCVYVAEMDNGLIKVGFSRNPRTRLQSLAKDMRRRLKTDVCRFKVSKDMDCRDAAAAESQALRLIRKIGKQRPGTFEYFTDVSFAVAVNLVAVAVGEKKAVA